MIIMLFHLFCMFHDYLGIAHRSQDSAGKSTVRMQYFGRSTVEGNYTKIPIFPDDEGIQKGEQRRAAMGPPHRPARALPWPRRPVRRRPTAPSRLIFFAYSFVPKT